MDTRAAIDLPHLARRLAANRDEAFADLVKALQGPMYSGALRLTGSRQDAEEVTQEAFVRAYRALDRYPPEQIRELRLQPWLWTIALNLCRNLARSRQRKPTPTSLDRHPEPVSTDSTEAAALDAVDDAWQRRLAELSLPERTGVILRHVVGLGYSEIAAALDRPTGTVKSDVHRGIDKLRTILASEGAEL
jgi:RNA polymerase sigma-70 factor (ECF subfamily)